MYPNIDRARKRLNKMHKRGEIRKLKPVNLIGYEERLWVCGDCPDSLAQHEGEFTEIAIHLFVDTVRRGPQVDPRFLADGEFDVGGEHFALELDRGSHGYKALLERASVYAEFNGDVLWVFSDEIRLQGFLARVKAQNLGLRHWGTTYQAILKEPHGLHFRNAEGLWNAIPRTGG